MTTAFQITLALMAIAFGRGLSAYTGRGRYELFACAGTLQLTLMAAGVQIPPLEHVARANIQTYWAVASEPLYHAQKDCPRIRLHEIPSREAAEIGGRSPCAFCLRGATEARRPQSSQEHTALR